MVLGISLCSANLHAATGKTSANPKTKVSVKGKVRTNTASSRGFTNASTKSTSKHKSRGKRTRGQANIDGRRTHEIQSALIREHYLSGSPSGNWDDATQKAMKRYQADHGWQSKTTPDARALIKLGLGPDQEHLLNPDSAMTMSSQPISPRSNPVSTSAVSGNPANENSSK
ncbi:MAG: hypothetical protein QOD84_3218 [Acidobacteriaceae bacterium]|jgi:hypothetical protein